ncbi:MAG: hypothetical protein ACKVT1_06130 [Dehalococcoidia bacterium]
MIHRGIVIVHGVGESGKGDYIDSFVEPLARFVGDALIPDNVVVEAENEPGEGPQTWATLRLRETGSVDPSEEWHIQEAWWTKTFRPSSGQTVLYWGVVAGLSILWGTLKNIFIRNLVRAFYQIRGKLRPQAESGGYDSRRIARTDLHGRPLQKDAPAPKRLGEDLEGAWTVAGAPTWKAFADAFIWLVITATYTVIAAIGLLMLIPFYLFLLTPLAFLFPKQVGVVQRKLVGILVSSIGDQQAMTSRRFALASASHEVARALAPMLDPAAIAARHERDPDFTGYTTVTVVAHSGGTIVSFDALATDVKAWLKQPVAEGLTRPSRVNWVTAGSGLNLAFRMRKPKSEQEQAFWERPIGDYVNWLNIYARYDPVPTGPPPDKLVDTLVGEDPWVRERPRYDQSRPPYVCLRVVNTDLPSADHSGYWRNESEVISRLVHVIMSDKLATERIDPQDVAFATSSIVPLREKVKVAIGRGRGHRNAVLARQLPVYLGLIGFLVFLFWASQAGAWLLGEDPFLGVDAVNLNGHTLVNIVPESLSGVDIENYRNFLVGAALFAFVGLTAAEIARLFANLAGWWRQGGSVLLVVVPSVTTILTGVIVALVIRHFA